MTKPSVAVFSLGCKTNQYEGSKLVSGLEQNGFRLVDFSDVADVYIVNSCTVTSTADKKTRQLVRRAREMNENAYIVLVGCFVSSRSDGKNMQGTKTLPADLVLDVEDKLSAIDIITKKFLCLADKTSTSTVDDMVLPKNRTRSYLKIQDGCNRYCAYCVIPYVRGRLVSEPFSDIISEARKLVALGRKELMLTGINIALYRSELDGHAMGLYELVKELSAIDGDFRIRLGSLEPNVFDIDEILRIMSIDKVCPHLHLSLQSGSDKILKTMNRNYNVASYLKIVSALRSLNQCFGLSTDIIVGFPGETEEDFEASSMLVEQAKFFHTHIFRYSKRPGTEAATMRDQIDETIKKERAKRLELIAKEASLAFSRSLKGSHMRALVIDQARAICDNGIELPGVFSEDMVNNFIDINTLR